MPLWFTRLFRQRAQRVGLLWRCSGCSCDLVNWRGCRILSVPLLGDATSDNLAALVHDPAPVLLLLPLFWLAARCRLVFAATAVFILAITIVWTITRVSSRCGSCWGHCP